MHFSGLERGEDECGDRSEAAGGVPSRQLFGGGELCQIDGGDSCHEESGLDAFPIATVGLVLSITGTWSELGLGVNVAVDFVWKPGGG